MIPETIAFISTIGLLGIMGAKIVNITQFGKLYDNIYIFLGAGFALIFWLMGLISLTASAASANEIITVYGSTVSTINNLISDPASLNAVKTALLFHDLRTLFLFVIIALMIMELLIIPGKEIIKPKMRRNSTYN